MAWLFASTLFLSASLLFFVQPLCAKMLLPTLGGAPAVWNTCMVFFQTALLLGYGYAHFGTRTFGLKGHALLHLTVLGLAFLSLPIAIPRDVAPPALPVAWLIQTLVVAVGLPFFVMASSGPLLQRWFVGARASQDPYFLYAASNLGSFAALILYPLLVEPLLTLRGQADLWMVGYGCFVAASLVCAACVMTRAGGIPSDVAVSRNVLRADPGWSTRLRWLLLALAPSSLMLSTTTYLTIDIAAIPLLWVIPLSIYLFTFVLAFSRVQVISHRVLIRWMPLIVLILALMFFLEGAEPVFAVLGLHLLGLFWLALVCHGELAHTRPAAENLTAFYLWLALGGVLGGVFNALVAPLLFRGLVEYPLMIAAVCLLRPAPATTPSRLKLDLGIALLVGALTLLLVLLSRIIKLEPGPISVAAIFALPLVIVYVLQSRPIAFGLGLALIFLAGALYPGVHGTAIYSVRSFFGIHRVSEQHGFRKLFHGNILHGQQSLDPLFEDEPLTYYHRTGPIGQVMSALQGTGRLKRVGLVGLGTGALASYAQTGQHWTFFEIDPAVVHIAAPETGLFTYLKDSRGRIDVVVGDGRLSLSRHPDAFGLLVIDAFGSDAIPLHLLTREALRVYTAHLADDGILAFHISNNYVDLEPVLANLAQDARPPMVCRIQKDLDVSETERRQGKSPSVWVLLARSASALGPLQQSGRWRLAQARPDMGVWTDDFSNLLAVLRFGD
jgi:hypothetical protein